MQISGKLRKFMPLFVTAILAAVIILPMWAGNTATTKNVAEINDLAGLKAAFEAGGEYKLTADIETNTYIEGNKDITLDLNGHKISRTNIESVASGDTERFCIRIFDGTFTINNSASTPGEIYAAEKDGVAAAPRAVGIWPAKNATNQHPSVVVNKGVKLSVKGTGGASGVHCLGVYTDHMTSSEEVTCTASAVINEGAILDASACAGDSKGRALSVEGYGSTVTIKGGEFKGGRQFITADCGAEVVINNGTFTSNNKGMNVESAFVTINGGTFTVASNKSLMWSEMIPEDYPGAYDRGKIVVNGGTFTGNMGEGKDNYGNYTGYIEIKKGTFYNDPTEFAVGSADVTYADGKWTVENKVKEISDATNLVNLLKKGGTFKLAADIEMPKNGEPVRTNKDVVLDMNGHKISKQSSYVRAEDKGEKNIFRVQDGTFTLNNSAEGEAEIFGDAVDNKYAVVRAFNVSPKWNGSGTKEGAAGSHPKLIVNGNGKIKIKVTGEAFNEEGKGSGMSRAIGIFTDDCPNTKDAIKCTAEGEINNATVESGSNAVTTDGFGTYLVINGGNYKGGRHALSNNIGETVVNDATLTGGSRYALYNCKGTLKVNGGSFATGTDEKCAVIYNDADEDKYYEDVVKDTTLTINGGTFVGKIVNYEDETQGKATITIYKGAFSVDPKNWVDKNATIYEDKETQIYLVTSEARPSQPIIEDEEKVPAYVDTKANTDPVAEEEVEKTVFAGKTETVGSGMVCVNTETTTAVIAKAFTSEKVEKVTPLPIFKSEIADAGKVAAVSMNINGVDLLATAATIEEVDLRKITDTTSGALVYKRISDVSEAKDGTFIVMSAFGKVATGNIDKDTVYQIVMFIKDNGDYDLDKTPKLILDPASLVKTTEQPTPSGGSSGGCNAGFGALALLMAIPMFYRRKK